MTEVVYSYATGNPIEERNNYCYAPHLGPAFLQAWHDNRARISALLPPATSPSTAEAVLGDAPSPTAVMLEDLYQAFTHSTVPPESEMGIRLATLIQRFEVSKRIYDSYDENLRPLAACAYHDLTLYLRFAEVLETAYRNDGRLPRLNALLKCIDTLCALHMRLDILAQSRLAWLIDAEAEHIAASADNLGVCW